MLDLYEALPLSGDEAEAVPRVPGSEHATSGRGGATLAGVLPVSGMKRSPMPPRTSPLSRAPIKRKQLTAEEKRARFARVYGSGERVEFVRRLPCLVCSSEPCDNAHVKGDGMGRKAEARFIVPLCTGPSGHHAVLHRMGTASFEAKYQRQLLGRTLLQWADLVEHAWTLRQGGEE